MIPIRLTNRPDDRKGIAHMRKSTLLQIMAVSMLSLSLQASTDGGAAATPTPELQISPLTTIKPLEVRTRRLHMVRPDLLHYPIQYDTFC